MKMCKSCREYLELFHSEFRPEEFSFTKSAGKLKTMDYCRLQFLDKDDKIKSCLILYSEKLSNQLDTPKQEIRKAN